ncbi:hypothetical protein FACS189449_10220 [Alphaproteobacteria bacterium]|nr:hypothetical protein FACS189449_10220 [Alphaproteobacteria bacterium]
MVPGGERLAAHFFYRSTQKSEHRRTPGVLREAALKEKDHKVSNWIPFVEIFHEITHAYHHMMLWPFELRNFRSEYAIFNSTEADFVGLSYPMLVADKMNPIVDKIVKCMDVFSPADLIECMNVPGYVDEISKCILFGRSKWNGYTAKEEKPRTLTEIVVALLKAAVDLGFGNAVFPVPRLDFRIDRTLTKETLARAIYVFSSAILYNILNERISVRSDCEEALTMTGLAPVAASNNSLCLFEDRQGEEIQLMGHQEKTEGGNYGRYYRFHAHITAERVAATIVKIITVICHRVKSRKPKENPNALMENLKNDIEKILRPATLRYNPDGIVPIAQHNEERTENARGPAEASDVFSPAYSTIATGSTEEVEKLIMDGMDPTSTVIMGMLPLTIAIERHNHAAIVALLRHIDAGRYGTTPLHLAVVWESPGAIIDLLGRGANPNITDTMGLTPLQLAIGREVHRDVVEALLESKKLDFNIVKSCYDSCFEGYIRRLLRETMDKLAHRDLIDNFFGWEKLENVTNAINKIKLVASDILSLKQDAMISLEVPVSEIYDLCEPIPSLKPFAQQILGFCEYYEKIPADWGRDPEKAWELYGEIKKILSLDPCLPSILKKTYDDDIGNEGVVEVRMSAVFD